MNTNIILVMAAIVVVLGAGYAIAGTGDFWNGMMGGFGNGNRMMGIGDMMGSYGVANGMMSNGGMMDAYGTDNRMMGNGSMMGSGGMKGRVNGFAAGNNCGAKTPDYGANGSDKR